MTELMKGVNERTSLAGANRLEVLLFSLGFDKRTGREELFGINVFKVREVMRSPEITHAPDMPPAVAGLVSLRGVMVPVINVAEFCNMEIESEPSIIIVTEYNRQTQALLVDSVDRILRMEWNDMKVPPAMLAHRMGGLTTAVTELPDKRIVMILDVERILSEAAQMGSDIDEYSELTDVDGEYTILFADDSSMARKQLETALHKMGITQIVARNGLEAWTKLSGLATRAENNGVPLHSMLTAVITDIEMPEMDGYVLTKKIKADSRFNNIPVIMHSSLSSEANAAIGRSVGADFYIPKFNPKSLSEVLMPILEANKAMNANKD